MRGETASTQSAGTHACVELRVSLRITDPEALRAYATSRHLACWREAEWEPSDLAQAAMEALVISNENPNPADYGIEILDFEAGPAPASVARVDRAARTAGRGGYWCDVDGRPYALAEILAGTSAQARRFLRERHLDAIGAVLRASLRAEAQGPGGEARALRHRARRLIGELDGWWVEQAQSKREKAD